MSEVFEDLLDWMEHWTTLHWQVRILYVVSGYQVTVEHDENVAYGPYESDTFPLALELAKDSVGYRE